VIPAHVKIVVCAEAVDMRYGFDRLARVVRDLGGDPESGSLFVFANRRASRLKVVWFERHGFCMLYKRLHRAVFEVPTGDGRTLRIDAPQLAKLLEGRAKRRRKS